MRHNKRFKSRWELILLFRLHRRNLFCRINQQALPMKLSNEASLQPPARYALAQEELAKFANVIRITREQDSVLFSFAPRVIATGIALTVLFATACLVLGLWLVSTLIPALFPALPVIGLCAGLIMLGMKLKSPAPTRKIAQWNEGTAELTLYAIDAENKLRITLAATKIAHLEIWHSYQGEDQESSLSLIGLQEERTLLLSETGNPAMIDSLGIAFSCLLGKKVFRRNADKTMEWLPDTMK